LIIEFKLQNYIYDKIKSSYKKNFTYFTNLAHISMLFRKRGTQDCLPK